jgi:hypothetical protein
VRLAAILAALALAVVLLGGCGSSGSSTSTGRSAPPRADGAKAPVGASARSCVLNAGSAAGLRAVGVSCREAQKVALAWRGQAACAATSGASHSACSVDRYRCLATRSDRGLMVSCAQPGHSISFTSKR